MDVAHECASGRASEGAKTRGTPRRRVDRTERCFAGSEVRRRAFSRGTRAASRRDRKPRAGQAALPAAMACDEEAAADFVASLLLSPDELSTVRSERSFDLCRSFSELSHVGGMHLQPLSLNPALLEDAVNYGFLQVAVNVVVQQCSRT